MYSEATSSIYDAKVIRLRMYERKQGTLYKIATIKVQNFELNLSTIHCLLQNYTLASSIISERIREQRETNCLKTRQVGLQKRNPHRLKSFPPALMHFRKDRVTFKL